MADPFANLTKAERIEKAVQACREHSRITARKAAKIFGISHTIISRRMDGLTKAPQAAHEHEQVLTPVEEQTLIKWAIQYYK